MQRIFAAALLWLCAVSAAWAGQATPPGDDFMLVLRETQGANKADYSLQRAVPFTTTLESGEEVTLHHAWYELIGDVHVRFVEDGEMTMVNLSREQFDQLGLTPEQAVDAAIANIRKRYGPPQADDIGDGLMQVNSQREGIDSASYFLDRAFWAALGQQYPDGVLVGVPQRMGMVYAPVGNAAAVAFLEDNLAQWYQEGGRQGLSQSIFLYKQGNWTVYRPAPKR